MSELLIDIGRVESIADNCDGGRIKVRLSKESNTPLSELPYAFPLESKVFHCIPKVGEAVLVFFSQSNNPSSQRYYIGPIVSQMQDITDAQYKFGTTQATSLLDGAIVPPKKGISKFTVTDGAFPDKNDVALVGRKSEDIVLKDGEIDIRCGIRKNALGDEDKDLVGNVLFNSEDPAYIQLKHKDNLTAAGDGVINIVADRINIVSHQDTDNDVQVKLVNANSRNGDKTAPLLHDEDVETLMSQLHQLPYGDILVEILRKMCNAITEHTHNFSCLPPCEDEIIKAVKDIDLNTVLSSHVRIS